MHIKTWFLETRPHFLLLSVVLVFLGTSIAWYNGTFQLGYALLALIGLILCHISVNVLNDYFDYRSGIDLKTKRTPFSGGSGILPASMLRPGQVLWFGLITFILAIPIGIYFVGKTGWMLLPLLIVGGACILLYTPVLTKLGWPEWAPGVGLGSLPVLGAYFVQTGDYTLPAIIASVPSGILVHNLLFLNEFPDAEADVTAHRKTLPIAIGKFNSSIVYAVLTALVYLWIIGGVVARVMPVFTLLALLTLPLGIKAIQGALKYEKPDKLIPAMGSNVIIILLIQVLMGVGYILAGILHW